MRKIKHYINFKFKFSKGGEVEGKITRDGNLVDTLLSNVRKSSLHPWMEMGPEVSHCCYRSHVTLSLSLSPLDHENFRVRLRGKTTRNSFFFRENL